MVQSAAMVDPADDRRFVRRHPAASLFLSKVAAVLGWCGGPFVLCELWTPALGRNTAFAVTALPLILQTWGWLHLTDAFTSDWARRSIRAGLAGNTLLTLSQIAGLLALLASLHAADLSLHGLGIVVGLAANSLYARHAGVWIAGAEEHRIATMLDACAEHGIQVLGGPPPKP